MNYLLIIILCCGPSAYPQDKAITVKIVDDLSFEPIDKVSVLVNDSLITQSNYLGYFQLNASLNDTISLRHDQYDNIFIIVPTVAKFQVELKVNEDYLDYAESIKDFYGHIAKNLRYPSKARRQKIVADLYVEFEIEKDGGSKVIKIHNDPASSFSDEITKSFATLSKNWNTRYAGCTFLLPVEFLLSTEPVPDNMEIPNINYDRILNEVTVFGGHSTTRTKRF